LRIGYGFSSRILAQRLWTMQLPFGTAITNLVAVAASYDAEDELRQRVNMITTERRHLQMRLRSFGVDSTESHANFLYLPARERPWREVFAGTGLHVRLYPDGAVRITVGARPSTTPVLSAIRTARGTR
jgi:histidinol-phosphate aminotransferase